MTGSTLNLWHSMFQLVAIVSAALALIAGAGTFWTGRLKEHAAAEAERQLRDQIRTEGEARRGLEKKTAGRRIPTGLSLADLRVHHGQRYSLSSIMADPEAAQYADDLHQQLRAAGWKNILGDEISQTLWMGRVPDAFLRVAPDVQSPEHLPACGPLAQLLTQTGNAAPIDMAPDLSTPSGVVDICVGPKRAI